MRAFFGALYRLTLLAASGPQAWVGLLIYAILLGLSFISIWVSIQFISWNQRFFDAVEQMNLDATWRELGIFGMIVGAWSALAVVQPYLRGRLQMRWRTRITDRALSAWVESKSYWLLRPGLSPQAVDNPDQRVAEDCNNFVHKLLLLSLDFIESMVAIVSYVVVLWGLSNHALTLSIFGGEVVIDRYIFWLGFLYVGLATAIIHWLGYHLKALYFQQERYEADFRHSLVQVRDNADEIAQCGGETAEIRRLNTKFGDVRGNWFRLIRREAILGLFHSPYFRTILRVPMFFSLPAYFAGGVTFGGMMQLAAAFGQVTQTLSWFIFNYKDLAETAAVLQRLDDLFATCNDPAPMPDAPRAIQHGKSSDGALHVADLRLTTPSGRALAHVPDTVVLPGSRVWIRGASGQGKSTLLAALSGFWPYGEGKIRTPDANVLFLSQTPRLFDAGLAATACYPKDPSDVPQDQIRSVLCKLGLEHRLPLLEEAGSKSLQGLSVGERQRLVMARALLNPPRWLVMDESTSALDPETEARVIALLRSELPETTILFVSHREPVALAPFAAWDIGADTDQRTAG